MSPSSHVSLLAAGLRSGKLTPTFMHSIGMGDNSQPVPFLRVWDVVLYAGISAGKLVSAFPREAVPCTAPRGEHGGNVQAEHRHPCVTRFQ